MFYFIFLIDYSYYFSIKIQLGHDIDLKKNVWMKVIMDEFHFRRAMGIVLAGSPSTQGLGHRLCWKGLLLGSVIPGSGARSRMKKQGGWGHGAAS